VTAARLTGPALNVQVTQVSAGLTSAGNRDRMPRQKLLDVGSYLTIAITLVLFVVALFIKGLTHDLLLEAGVFLVSAKLVLMSYQNRASSEAVHGELQQLRRLLERRADEP
jgi:hypothetical protein